MILYWLDQFNDHWPCKISLQNRRYFSFCLFSGERRQARVTRDGNRSVTRASRLPPLAPTFTLALHAFFAPHYIFHAPSTQATPRLKNAKKKKTPVLQAMQNPRGDLHPPATPYKMNRDQVCVSQRSSKLQKSFQDRN